MLGHIGKILCRLAFRIDLALDSDCFFLGAECKVEMKKSLFGEIMRLFVKRRFKDIDLAFARLEENASEYEECDKELFMFKTAVSGDGLPLDLPDHWRKYLLEKAFMRGQSLKRCRELKFMLCVARNSTYGFFRIPRISRV